MSRRRTHLANGARTVKRTVNAAAGNAGEFVTSFATPVITESTFSAYNIIDVLDMPAYYKGLSVLIPDHEIHKRVNQLADDVVKYYSLLHGGHVHLVIVMTGAETFFFEFQRALFRKTIGVQERVPFSFSHITCESMHGTESSGTLTIKNATMPFDQMVAMRVCFVDDIEDTTVTGRGLAQKARDCGVTDVELMVLVRKMKNDTPAFAKFIGFHIPDRFVVGKGMDYRPRHVTPSAPWTSFVGEGRSIPHICLVETEFIEFFEENGFEENGA